MNPILKLLKTLSLVLLCAFIALHGTAQVKTKGKHKLAAPKPKPAVVISEQLAEFKRITNRANADFIMPQGFKEIPAVNNEDFSFDYAMEIPGKDFEVWFQVRSQKENWASYERVMGDEKLKLANPDSVYIEIGKAQASALTGDQSSFTKNLPATVLNRYRADAGKSYMLNLLDLPDTKRYQYALLITLQKYHTGNIVMICFTNEKNPEFFKNVDKAGNSLKFRQSATIVNKLAD
ncbi:hypothetical protein GCM10023149_34890 [Mucilaginibacter gynuensis]|uniref:Uncharacterized protein n=1 Tax=Mucilaginibacter gynuensis TaxID=1302236 RepID=A0ABP8GU36_9SPHI